MRRVLLVDDDELLCALVRLTLRRRGFDVVTAEDAEQALERLAAGLPDLVLLDVMLPGMDGLELLAQLRADPRTAHLPVLVLSARGREDDVAAGFAAGADGYVTKPFAPQELVARVERACLPRAA